MQERTAARPGYLCHRRFPHCGGDSRDIAGDGSGRSWCVSSWLPRYITNSLQDLIELGLPFTDPIADGPTIQKANTQALKNGVTVYSTLDMVREARKRGLKVPVLFMGYYNPLLSYGEERILKDAKEAGVNGFIVVDLPPEEAVRFRNFCTKGGYDLSLSTKHASSY